MVRFRRNKSDSPLHAPTPRPPLYRASCGKTFGNRCMFLPCFSLTWEYLHPFNVHAYSSKNNTHTQRFCASEEGTLHWHKVCLKSPKYRCSTSLLLVDSQQHRTSCGAKHKMHALHHRAKNCYSHFLLFPVQNTKCIHGRSVSYL